MGNALELKCPNCGDEGEKLVSQTNRDVRRAPIFGFDTVSCRWRQRRCSSCKTTFRTVELTEDDFVLLVERHLLSEKLVYRINGELPEVQDPARRNEALAGLRLIHNVFSEKFPKSWDDIYPISEEEAALIVSRVNEVLNDLEPVEQEAVRSRAMAPSENSAGTYLSVDDKVFQTAMRKLMHPSRSRKLRPLHSLSLRGRRQV